MNEPGSVAPRSRTARVLVLLASVLTVLAVAVLCAFFLQFSTHPHWGEQRPETEMLFSPLDAAVITVVIAGVWALIGRLSLALGLVSGFAFLLAGINYSKIVLRREPVYPADSAFVTETGSLLTMVDPETVRGIAVGVAVTVVVIPLLGWVIGRWLPPPRLRHADGGLNRRLIGLRLVTFVLSAVLVLHAAQFNQPRNFWRAMYDVNADWQPWSQVHNYRSNGFVGGFLSNMPMGVMERPTGYGAEAMARISADYAQRAAMLNTGRTGSIADANVVFVLSESFTDPSWLDGFALAENPIPVTQGVMAQTLAGRMYASSYGGGTATMEFESLTGQSVGLFNPWVTLPYPMFVADQSSYPSAVGAFAELGHRTVAIHSYNLDMYKRTQVYQTLGFHDVIDDAAMQSQERIETSRYISDAAAFDEVLHQLDRSAGPDFVKLLTMQNHGAYGGSYSDPIASDIEAAGTAEEYGQYTRGLAHTDAALAGFLAQLKVRDEQTIVVFYGDHHPGIYPEDIMNLNQPDATFTTPFFVWNSRTNQAQTVEAIGPAMFLPLVYEAADAPVPPYVAMLDDVRRSVPVLQPSRMLDAHGRPVERGDLDDRTSGLLDDLRMAQYDFSAGERFAVDALWPGAVVEKTN